ncbi:MAG: hypothetical protein KAT39_15055, partial [Alphaproteobacteria bacterium]|nr:hypothetical protein [Alphaproteobacteria bacterium]
MLAALAVFVVLVLAGVLALLYSESGRTVLARYLEEALSTPGEIEIEISRLHGRLPAEIRIDRIAVSDSGGTWMTVRDFELDWSPLELFGARLRIDSARASEVTILRRPAPPARDQAGSSLPPVEIALDSLSVDLLRLEEPVLGQAAGLALTASVSALKDRVTARLKVDRVDGSPGRASAVLY